MQLKFRIGSIPVRISGAFLFLALVLGAQEQRPDRIAVVGFVIFVSILVHELGHALMGRRFGLVPTIDLGGMGGLTSWESRSDVGPGRSIAISLAGPFAGLLVGGAMLLAARMGFAPQHALAVLAVRWVLWVNIGWSVFNLSPMLPLDGGNVLRSTLDLVTKGRGEKPARIVSMVTGGLFIVYALTQQQLWLGAMVGFFTWANFRAYRQVDTRNADLPLARAVNEAYVALEKHDGAAAIALLRPVIVPQASQELRAIALRVFSYALLIEGEWEELLPTLHRNASLIGVEEMMRYATTARELGRLAEADRIASLVTRLAPVVPRPANDFG